jgi:Tetratricopeptide repeat
MMNESRKPAEGDEQGEPRDGEREPRETERVSGDARAATRPPRTELDADRGHDGRGERRATSDRQPGRRDQGAGRGTARNPKKRASAGTTNERRSDRQRNKRDRGRDHAYEGSGRRIDSPAPERRSSEGTVKPHRRASERAGRSGSERAGRSGSERAGGAARSSARSGRDRSKRPDAGSFEASTERRSRRDPKLEHEPVHLGDDIVAELRSTARPGKAEILVKVFAEAAAAYAAGDLRTTLRLADQAKHIALRAASVRELLGLCLYHSERYQDAARELSAFRRLTGSDEQNPVIADSYRAMKKPQRALQLTDEMRADQVSPAVFYEGQIVAAGALADMGRLDEAIERLEALELRPATAREHHLRAWYALADLLEARGRFTKARDLFEAVASSDSDLTDAPERLRRLSRRAR